MKYSLNEITVFKTNISIFETLLSITVVIVVLSSIFTIKQLSFICAFIKFGIDIEIGDMFNSLYPSIC